MIKDIIRYNDKEYQLSTVNLDGMFETMIFPIENGIVSGREVYRFETFKAGESKNKHEDIYYHPDKYLSDEAITEYLKSKEIDDDIEIEEKIPFPFQYMEQYFRGELIWDAAIDNTMDEVYRLIEEYVENHDLKT